MNHTTLPTLSLADQAWLSRTIATNRTRYAGWSMDGSDAGGSGGDAGGDKPADKPADKPPAGGDSGGASDKGFPENTPIAQMTVEQRAAYWEHQSKKHETQKKDMLRLTGNKYGDDLKADLDELSELRKSKMSADERAVADAEDKGRKAALSTATTKFAEAAFELVLPGELSADERREFIDNTRLENFVTPDGGIDTAKVRAYVEKYAPAKDTGTPRDYGQGRRSGLQAKGTAAGADLYAERNKKKSHTN